MVESKAVLPCKVSLNARFVDQDNVEFDYMETFAPEHVSAGDRTFNALAPLAGELGLKVERPAPEAIRVTGTIPYGRLGSMMVTEFLCWSEIGEMRLRELILLPMLGAIELTRDSMLEQHAQQLQEIADGIESGMADMGVVPSGHSER